MIQKVYGVRDNKALAFLQPFFSTATGSAIRAFTDAVNEKNGSPLTKHPGDFMLYELGDFNDSTGEFIPKSPIVLLGTGSDFVSSVDVGSTAYDGLRDFAPKEAASGS